MKRNLSEIFVISAICLVIGAGMILGDFQTARAASTYTINIGCTVPTDHPIAHGFRVFAAEVEKLSDGRLKANIMDGGQLGTGRKLFESVQNNVIQVCDNSIGPMAVFTNKLNPLSLPYLFPSREVAYKFADGAYAAQLSKEVAEETGMKIVAWYENGIRQMTNSARPIKTPADLNGLKVRVMESPLFIKIFEALGASPVPMSYAELYTALQQKTVDGQENPVAIIVTSKFYETQSHLSTTAHNFDYIIVVVNEDFYNSLPADLQKIFDQAMAISQTAQRENSIMREASDMEFLGKAMTITYLTDAERLAFRDKMQPVYNWFETSYPDQVENMKRIMQEISDISAVK
jgi:C4-dicarboxylate-binding protein DctP